MEHTTDNAFRNETQFIFSDEFVGFTTIPNYIFKCKELSYKAVGMYCSILQFQNSDKHSISIKGLMATHADGQTSVQSGLNELIKQGFIERTRLKNVDGTFKCMQYIIRMKPVVYQEVEPKVDFPNTETPNTENSLNKKENDVKKKISKKDDDDAKSSTNKNTKTINQSINQSETIVDEVFIKAFKNKWLEVLGKRLILSVANKEKLMGLCAKFESEEVLEALNRINESDFLKQAITITHFITKFENIANGNYSTWTKVESNAPGAANKVNKFVKGCEDHNRDFDGLERLEAAKVAYDLGQIGATEYEAIRLDVLGQ